MQSVLSEYNKLKIDVNEGVAKQYHSFIERVVRANPADDSEYIHLYKVLHRFILPLNIFSWIFQSINGVNEKFFHHIVKKKLEQDKFVNEVLDVLRAMHFEVINIDQLDNIFEGIAYKNDFHTYFIFELLTEVSYSSNMDRQQSHRVNHIRDRYLTLIQTLNQGIYEVGMQPDHTFLTKIMKIMKTNNVNFKFDKENYLEHNYIYEWIRENVIKGLSGHPVGCRSEVVNMYKTSSNNLEDYLKTLLILHENM